MCAKNHLLIFSSFLDIWENVEWPRFLDHPVYIYLLKDKGPKPLTCHKSEILI